MRAAIVEDDVRAAQTLQDFAARYAQQSGLPVEFVCFPDGAEFLAQYDMSFDLVLMDIQMPHLDGMRAAKQIRAMDEKVLIVFVTNMAKYAIEGYQVDALDFILKPVSFFKFSNMMDKVCLRLERRKLPSVLICTKREMRRVDVSSIRYVEIQGHKLFYHLDQELIESWGSLSALVDSLPPRTFSQANAGTMVNLNAVIGVKGDKVVLPGETVTLSRRRKKEFCTDLAYYLGEKLNV